MEIDFVLENLLRKHGLYEHGVQSELAEHMGINRGTLRRLLNNEGKTISLEALGRLCDWLQSKRVPMHDLPGALFYARAPRLWQEVAGRENVIIYIGDYVHVRGGAPAVHWISRRDSTLANRIAEELPPLRARHKRAKGVHIDYVPFRFTTRDGSIGRGEYFADDVKTARRMFSRHRSGRGSTASIFVGSQEVNLFVECVVAELFGCTPFRAVKGKPRVPVHLVFRHDDPDMHSCFGGVGAPPGHEGPAKPGLYYRDGKDEWVFCPWRGDRDAGVVIVARDRGTKATDVVLFGYSGWATAAMTEEVVPKAGPFWPPAVNVGGKEVGVYICDFHVREKRPSVAEEGLGKGDELRVIRLDGAVLRKYLRKPRSR